jgi:ABC-type transport system involved in multi-copper enzyme maturation permease subunit
MINWPYTLLIWRINRGLILFGFLLVGFLQFVIISIFSSLEYTPFIELFIKQLPPQLQAVFSEEFINRFSINGAAAFGYNHPLVLSILGIAAITIPARHLAGEAETGTLEILMAHPFRRDQYFISLWFSAAMVIFFIILGGWCGSFSALILKQKFNPLLMGKLLQIGINLWFLFLLIMSCSITISGYGREGNKAGLMAAAITLFFYLLYFLGTIWEEIHFSKIFNIFHYYQPQKLMFGQKSFWLNSLVLLILTSILFFLAKRQIEKRDIP